MLRQSFLICMLLVTCNNKDTRLEKKFFSLPPAERTAIMRSSSLEDQYKIFRYGMDKREPPVLSLAEPIAQRGSTAIPFLTEQLKSTNDDAAVRDILWVLKRMADDYTYDLKQNGILVGILQKRISRMKSAWWQSYCRDNLEEIIGKTRDRTVEK
jgi:hypothetical protein